MINVLKAQCRVARGVNTRLYFVIDIYEVEPGQACQIKSN